MSQHDTLTLERALRAVLPHIYHPEALRIAHAALSAAQPAQAAQSDWSTQRFNAPVYPPDGTESPFTVINLGSGKVQMGDSIHDGRLPALWFGINGQGMGHEETMNREAHPGETLAVVTFANVEGLDVLLDVIQRIRREKFPEAQAAQGEPVPSDQSGWCAYVGGMVAHWVKSAPDAHARLGDDKFEAAIAGIIERRLWALRRDQAPAQPAAGADVLDAQRYRWLRDQHQGQTEQAYDAEGFPLPQEPTAIACTVFKPGRDLCLEPISCTPGELDAHIDAAIAASGRQE